MTQTKYSWVTRDIIVMISALTLASRIEVGRQAVYISIHENYNGGGSVELYLKNFTTQSISGWLIEWWYIVSIKY